MCQRDFAGLQRVVIGDVGRLIHGAMLQFDAEAGAELVKVKLVPADAQFFADCFCLIQGECCFNFGQGANHVTVMAATPNNGEAVEMRLDSPSGPRIATLDVTHTGSWSFFREYTVALSQTISGVRNLYVKFVDTHNQTGSLLNLKEFIFEKKATTPLPSSNEETLLVYDPVTNLAPSPYYTYSVQKVSLLNAPLKQNATNWELPFAWFSECKRWEDPFSTAYYAGEFAGWSHTYCNFELGRISCKETSTDRVEQQYATPRWVMEAGAKGGYYRDGKAAGPDAPWEPVFELEHYGTVKRLGNWDARPDSLLAKHGGGLKGPDFFRGALDLLHATYIGYHGDAREWLTDNPALTGELLNRCGYWYCLHGVGLPYTLRAGVSNPATMVWENRGVAPAYHAYQLKLRLEGPETIDLTLDSQNRSWVPVPHGATHTARYVLDIPKTARPGRYTLKLKLHSPEAQRDVFLALDPKLLDGENFYSLGMVNIAE